MKRNILSLGLVVALLITSLGMIGGTASAQTPTGTVNTGALNIRTGPGITYSVITFVYRNTVFTLLTRNADASWIKVVTSTGVQGWVSAKYVLTAYPIGSLPVDGTGGPYAGTGTVTSYGLNLRTGPGVSYSRITALSRGTGFTLLARNATSTWVKIALYDGRQGWIHSGYITTTIAISSLPVEGSTPPTPPSPPPSGQRTHVVRSGENLFRIALWYGVDMYNLARLNGITNLTLIYVGQVLLIP